MMTSPHEGLKRKGWDISVKTFVLENGNNSLFAGCFGFNLYSLCSMKDNSSNKNEITAIIPSIL